MSKVSLIAKLQAAEGKADELTAALHDLVAAAEVEPGLEVYSAHVDPNAEGVFYFFELYTDQAAFEAHGKDDRMKAAMGALGGFLGGRPEITILTPVVAKGLDL
ncbi:MAG: putative quinol monooxygenase [Actinomycetota bacterium]